MITVERLDKIQQDLEWARENADRSAQTRLFVHHVPFLLTILRPVAEALDAQIAEEEEYLAEIEEEEIDLSLTTEEGSEDTKTIADKVRGLFSSDDGDSTESQIDERTDEGDAQDSIAEPGSPTALAEDAAIAEAAEEITEPDPSDDGERLD
jgi:hypothetical protein